jgi:hypothetical protein
MGLTYLAQVLAFEGMENGDNLLRIWIKSD